MDLQPAETRQAEVVSAWSRTAALPEPHHAGLLQGATLTGEAARRHLSVRIGLWLDEAGWVRQARWRAVDDSSLREYAEAACSLLESGADPVALDAEALRSAVEGGHADRAELVASALHAALVVGGPREM
ncbi:MAG TPA: hypothetical protein VFP65_03030 [Anaeromyxobacteraceae bacterium]|nr:hypothetical protein [Anaeromyxobacteraceae bacterium]